MKALTKILAGGVVAAALFTAAPAAAQYYPGYGQPYGYGQPGYGQQYGYGNPVGQVLNQVLGGGYGYGANSQVAVGQCVNAVQARMMGGYNNYGGGGAYSGYSYYPYANSYPGGRVLGISRVEQRSGGGLTIRGVASSGRNSDYGYGGQQRPDLTFKCKSDYRGYITDVDIDRARSTYGTNYSPYTPYNQDYSQYGYRRY